MSEGVENGAMKLTPKQEAFCQAVFSGMTLADSYRKAYNSENMLPATIHSRASELRADGRITARLNELYGDLQNATSWDRERATYYFMKIIEATRVGEDGKVYSDVAHKDMVAALKELNAMHGTNAPSKAEITGAGGVPLNLSGFYPKVTEEKEE